MSYWLDNATGGNHMLIDLGYTSEPGAREGFEALRAVFGLRNFERVGHDRLIARVPPRKAGAFARFPQVVKADSGAYCWCSHRWDAKAGEAAK